MVVFDSLESPYYVLTEYGTHFVHRLISKKQPRQVMKPNTLNTVHLRRCREKVRGIRRSQEHRSTRALSFVSQLAGAKPRHDASPPTITSHSVHVQPAQIDRL